MVSEKLIRAGLLHLHVYLKARQTGKIEESQTITLIHYSVICLC